MKLTEVRCHIGDAREYITQVKIEAEKKGSLSLYKIVNHEEFYERIRKKVELLYENVKTTNPSLGVTLYEISFHELHDIQKELESSKRIIESMVKSHKENPVEQV